MCMPLLLSFAWAYSTCEEREMRNYKMKNSCPLWDWNPGPSASEANSLSVSLQVEIYIDHLNVDRVLPKFAI